ncbi:CreA family protein [Devosia chinhatensis]|uniref:CREA protein n=1 Tax=Devosia chinhatensis TaxID=429727 RepID=A0A0F5FGL7_9HYPH|nr:CreA family protein [Devosia chinhatensis]KKB07943.1 CREA protein [Devosia chinhatensis]
MHHVARVAILGFTALALAACGRGGEVGNVGVDWTGNDISIEAVADPDVQGVVCHLAFFNRSFIDRVSQGNWFEDPSYSALDCSAIGPITIGNVRTSAGGQEIFQQGRSLIWKSLRVTRIYDAANNALIYLGHAREIQQGSGKMSLSVVPLNGLDVTWTNGAPASQPMQGSIMVTGE